VLLPRGFSDLSAIPRGRPYNAITQLREIPARKSSFLEVHPAQGVTTWVPTHAPQPLVTRLGCVSAFLSYHARGLPLGRGPLPCRICPRDSPKVARVATSYTSCMSTSRVRLLPNGTGNMALKPPFPSLYYCFEVPRPEASSPVPWPLIVPLPPRSSLPAGIGGWHHRGQSALLGQRVTPLRWETLKPGNAHTWRRPYMTMLKAVNTLTFLLGAPWWVPLYV